MWNLVLIMSDALPSGCRGAEGGARRSAERVFI